MASGRYNSVSKTIGTIDITPLMDLTFMLLIIFIITVPALEFTTEVTPPDMNTATAVEQIDNKVMLTMNEKGEAKLEDEPGNQRLVAVNMLEEELAAVFSRLFNSAMMTGVWIYPSARCDFTTQPIKRSMIWSSWGSLFTA